MHNRRLQAFSNGVCDREQYVLILSRCLSAYSIRLDRKKSVAKQLYDIACVGFQPSAFCYENLVKLQVLAV